MREITISAEFEGKNMTDRTVELNHGRPFKPSLVDRFNIWVENLPVRAWIFYLVFVVLLILVQIIFLWMESGLLEEQLLPIIIFNGLATPFTLALIHILDNRAVTALNSMRPVLNTTKLEFDLNKYKLANMPYPRSLVSGLILMVLVMIMERIWVVPIRYAALDQLPTFTVVYHVIDKSTAFMMGVFIYHSIRQLRMVNTINSKHVRINLFNLGPLQSFSRLTGSTAVGLVVGIYGWMLINPDLMKDRTMIGFIVLFTILAVMVFVWPLYGVHRRMVATKERALHEIDFNFEAVFSNFNTGIRDEDYSAIEKLNPTITSLEIQHNRISDIPTWPWRPETASFALTAITLPLVLSILRFLVERAFG